MADEVLLMEARLLDNVTKQLDKIRVELKATDSQAGRSFSGASEHAGRFGTAIGHLPDKVLNVNRVLGKLTKSYFSLGLAVFGTIHTIKSWIDAYEEYAKVAGGEEANKILEMQDKQKIADENLGKRLEVLTQYYNSLTLSIKNTIIAWAEAAEKGVNNSFIEKRGGRLVNMQAQAAAAGDMDVSPAFSSANTISKTPEQINSEAKASKDLADIAQKAADDHWKQVQADEKRLEEDHARHLDFLEAQDKESAEKRDKAAEDHAAYLQKTQENLDESRIALIKDDEQRELAEVEYRYQKEIELAIEHGEDIKNLFEAEGNEKIAISRKYTKQKLEDAKKESDEEQRIQESVVNTTIGGLVDVSNTMSKFAQDSLARNAHTKEEQKKAAETSALISFATSLGASDASIWSTPGGSWQEKLAESITISAALTAGFGVQLATIEAAATGTNFTTNGRKLLMVGDNPGGRERVSVSPVGSPNVYGGGGDSGGSGITIHVNDATTGDKVVRLLQRALRDGSSRNLVSDLKGRLAIA